MTRKCLLSVMFAVCLTASTAWTATLQIEDAVGYPGMPVAVSIRLSDAGDNVAGINATITYDGTNIEAGEVVKDAINVGDAQLAEGNLKQSGEYRFVIYPPSAPIARFANPNDIVAQVIFDVAPGAPEGDYPLALTDTIVGDAMLRATAVSNDVGTPSLPLTLVGGTLTVEANPFPETKDYATSSSGWDYAGINIMGQPLPPIGQWEAERLKIESQQTTDTFGQWVSPADEIAGLPDSLYRGTFTISSDEVDPVAVPKIRLRAESQNFQSYTSYEIISQPPGDHMPRAGTDYTYEFLFTNPPTAREGDGIRLGFDLINVWAFGDSATATNALEGWTVERYSKSAVRATLGAPVTQETFATDPADAWTFGAISLLGQAPSPTGDYDAGQQALYVDIASNADEFAYWMAPANPTMVANVIYVMDMEVSCDVVDRGTVPDLRFRLNDTSLQLAAMAEVKSFSGGGLSPNATPAIYSLYLYPHQDLVDGANKLQPNFDMINFTPTNANAGKFYLHTVTVSTAPTPW